MFPQSPRVIWSAMSEPNWHRIHSPPPSPNSRTTRVSAASLAEYLEALSWMARGTASAQQWDKAAAYATETRTLAEKELTKRKLDAEPHLPVAVGAAYEVLAQALEAKGKHAQAVALLRSALTRYGNTSIQARLQKNLNVLALVGQPAPRSPIHPVSRTKAAHARLPKRIPRSFIFLGALVHRLQSRSPADRPPAPGVRSQGISRHRPHSTLRLRRPRSRCLA